jgi:hypothetical protein
MAHALSATARASAAFKIRYHCGETEIDEADADSLDQARNIIALKVSDLTCKAEVALIFRVSPSGTEELEESRKLHA